MNEKKITRRDFIKSGSASLIGLGLGAMFGDWIDLGDGKIAMAASEGYLIVDTKKCAGCQTCMIACSLAHEGKANPSLSRIQIIQNCFESFPNDIQINQCRQCPSAPCHEACPVNALIIDEKNGNVRRIDEKKCIGCEKCIEACPYTPSRIIWNFEAKHAQKCDLCAKTPFWDEKGGPDGKQMCMTICPMKAIKFTKEIPVQNGGKGYNVNLRGKGWENLGGNTED